MRRLAVSHYSFFQTRPSVGRQKSRFDLCTDSRAVALVGWNYFEFLCSNFFTVCLSNGFCETSHSFDTRADHHQSKHQWQMPLQSSVPNASKSPSFIRSKIRLVMREWLAYWERSACKGSSSSREQHNAVAGTNRHAHINALQLNSKILYDATGWVLCLTFLQLLNLPFLMFNCNRLHRNFLVGI